MGQGACKNVMSGRLVVKRYARALLEVAEEADGLDAVQEDMQVLDRLMKEAPAIRGFCLEQHAQRAVEFEFVKTAFIPYVEEFTTRMILTLITHGRLAAIPFIPSAFAALLEQRGDTITVLLETAHKPGEGVLNLVTLRTAEKTGKKINLHVHIVPELLGGFRIIWQNKILDMSVRGRLRKARALLK